jgi:hypothetical protein
MKPSVGRIVHVLVDPNVNNGSDVAPAVITRVWSDNCVNLRVLHDGPSIAAPAGRQDWLTSFTLHDSREALEEHRAARQAELPEGQTVSPFGAFWPPRV